MDEENYSAWGMPSKHEDEGEQYPERYDPPSVKEQANDLLDEYIKRKKQLNKIKKMRGAEEVSKIYDHILKKLGDKLNEIW